MNYSLSLSHTIMYHDAITFTLFCFTLGLNVDFVRQYKVLYDAKTLSSALLPSLLCQFYACFVVYNIITTRESQEWIVFGAKFFVATLIVSIIAILIRIIMNYRGVKLQSYSAGSVDEQFYQFKKSQGNEFYFCSIF